MTGPWRLALALALALPPSLGAQSGEPLNLFDGRGDAHTVELRADRGHTAFPAQALEAAGWRVTSADGAWLMILPEPGVRVAVEPGSPFLAWNDTVVQMAGAPYVVGDELHLPLQFATDLLPDRLPGHFTSSGPRALAVVVAGAPARRPVNAPPPPFVVVIDPGHGGEDPGAMGPGGTREKDLALEMAMVLADSLRARTGFEVHLTRETDVLVPLWQRGEMATRLKGDRPGVFISIHANALAARDVRGVETYFLSEARTEHERRVAALENAPLALERAGPFHQDPDLGFILKELRNHDHQHWSADLAGLVQKNLAAVHPGPNRGVKQGPLAVITNALMPAVLVEVGFITNRDEERALRQEAFQARAAGAVARAVDAFARRYPPGRPTAVGGDR